MNVSLLLVPSSEKVLIRNLMQAYLHDMSAFNGDDPDPLGVFQLSKYFPLYWQETDRYPFKIMVGDTLAGFALVREVSADTHSIAEFFVLRKHRGKGIGRETAVQLFDMFPGYWQVSQDEGNMPAQKFWREVISVYTGDAFEETWSPAQPRGPKQLFRSAPGS